MGRSVTFDHTADLGLRIYATDLADLFRTAAEALFDVIVTNRDRVDPLESEQFHLAADSTDALLLDWLNELISTVCHGSFCLITETYSVTPLQSPGESIESSAA